MIECISCRTCIDVSEDDAYDLGWQYDSLVDGWGEYVGHNWYCPHCVHMEEG